MALMEKKRAMILGKGAMHFVKSKITLGSSNNILNPLGWITPEWKFSLAEQSIVSICVDQLRTNASSKAKTSNADLINKYLIYADQAEKSGCGNCGEQSALAFAWLMRHRAVPVEIMKVTNGDHAFCVLNRDSRTDPAHPDQWNEESVYCDPWRSLISYGRQMSVVNRRNKQGFGSLKYHFESVVRLEK